MTNGLVERLNNKTRQLIKTAYKVNKS